jgi:hypothetical protein
MFELVELSASEVGAFERYEELAEREWALVR